MRQVSEATIDRTLAVLAKADRPLRAYEVGRRICRTSKSASHALRELVARGLVAMEAQQGPSRWAIARGLPARFEGGFVAPWVYALSPAGRALAEGNSKEGG